MEKVPKKSLRIAKKLKFSNPYKVSKKFLKMVNEFAEEHDDALRELAER